MTRLIDSKSFVFSSHSFLRNGRNISYSFTSHHCSVHGSLHEATGYASCPRASVKCARAWIDPRHEAFPRANAKLAKTRYDPRNKWLTLTIYENDSSKYRCSRCLFFFCPNGKIAFICSQTEAIYMRSTQALDGTVFFLYNYWYKMKKRENLKWSLPKLGRLLIKE